MTKEKKEEEDKKENLKEKVKKYKKLKDKYLDNWKRERAAFLNYKKEGSKRIESLTDYVKTSMILKLLPVLDSFDLAEKEIPDELKNDENVKGLLQIKKQIKDFLKNEEVTEMECLNKEFDPNFHDIVESVEKKGAESGTIIEEVKKGYKIKNKLLRPAKVKVVK